MFTRVEVIERPHHKRHLAGVEPTEECAYKRSEVLVYVPLSALVILLFLTNIADHNNNPIFCSNCL